MKGIDMDNNEKADTGDFRPRVTVEVGPLVCGDPEQYRREVAASMPNATPHEVDARVEYILGVIGAVIRPALGDMVGAAAAKTLEEMP